MGGIGADTSEVMAPVVRPLLFVITANYSSIILVKSCGGR